MSGLKSSKWLSLSVGHGVVRTLYCPLLVGQAFSWATAVSALGRASILSAIVQILFPALINQPNFLPLPKSLCTFLPQTISPSIQRTWPTILLKTLPGGRISPHHCPLGALLNVAEHRRCRFDPSYQANQYVIWAQDVFSPLSASHTQWARGVD